MTDPNIVSDHPDWDVYDDYTGPESARIIDDPTLPVTLYDTLVPLDEEEMYVPNHLDADGTVHFFAAVDVSNQPDYNDLSHELRYFRAAQTDDGRLVHDAHTVMPLANRGDTPFPRHTLEMMLMEGDLDNAQELAYQTALSHGLNFPDPDTLPPLNTGVEYRFETGIEDDGSPAIEAVKTWREGAQDHEARLTIASYGMAAALNVDMRELTETRERDGLEVAMNLAESIAVAGGYLHDGRDDTRIFTEGPPDPFTTNLERERSGADFIRDYGDEDTQPLPAVTSEPMSTYAQWGEEARREREANAPLDGSAWFEATFADHSEIHLIEPVDDTVNYAVVVTDTDPWTTELMVEKVWCEPGGYPGMDTLTIDTYDSDDETKREVADAARATLLGIYDELGLQAMMRQAELSAMENGYLSGDRTDMRLFRDGPPDRFETLAQRLEGEPNPFSGIGDDHVDDETQELPMVMPQRVYLLDETDITQPAPGSWEELLAAQIDDEPAPDAHYWQMHYRPVETPDGEKLGTALFVTEFPQLPPDFDDYIDENGMDDTVYPTEARTLEMAHFANEKDAAKFDAEFRGYLVPDVLDAIELAPEVAKLEGLSGDWEDMNYRGIVDYMSGRRTVVREASEWHLHDPNAEHEARIAEEGLEADSIQSISVENKSELRTLDIDL